MPSTSKRSIEGFSGTVSRRSGYRTHVRFNYADFGLEQAIGAIKARVQEAGGTIAPLNAPKRAELARQETQYLKEKVLLRSPFGRDTVAPVTLELFTEIKELSAEIDASGSASIQFASDTHQCHLRNRQVSPVVTLDSYSESKLLVREFDNRLAMRGENLAYLNGQPQVLRETTFLPDMNRAREYGWSEEEHPSKFLPSSALADTIVSQFIDLAARAERGDLV